MGKTAYINTRIDPELKAKAEGILSAVGVSASQALTMFYRQVVYRRGIPFDVCVPNDATIAALEEAAAGGGETHVARTADVFDAIEAEDDNRGE